MSSTNKPLDRKASRKTYKKSAHEQTSTSKGKRSLNNNNSSILDSSISSAPDNATNLVSPVQSSDFTKLFHKSRHLLGDSKPDFHGKANDVPKCYYLSTLDKQVVDLYRNRGYLPAMNVLPGELGFDAYVAQLPLNKIIYNLSNVSVDCFELPEDIISCKIPTCTVWHYILMKNMQPTFPILDRQTLVQNWHNQPYNSYKDCFDLLDDAYANSYTRYIDWFIKNYQRQLGNRITFIDSQQVQHTMSINLSQLFIPDSMLLDDLLHFDREVNIYELAFLFANSLYTEMGYANHTMSLGELRFITLSLYVGFLVYPFGYVRFDPDAVKCMYDTMTPYMTNAFIDRGAFILSKILTNKPFAPHLKVQPSVWGAFIREMYHKPVDNGPFKADMQSFGKVGKLMKLHPYVLKEPCEELDPAMSITPVDDALALLRNDQISYNALFPPLNQSLDNFVIGRCSGHGKEEEPKKKNTSNQLLQAIVKRRKGQITREQYEEILNRPTPKATLSDSDSATAIQPEVPPSNPPPEPPPTSSTPELTTTSHDDTTLPPESVSSTSELPPPSVPPPPLDTTPSVTEDVVPTVPPIVDIPPSASDDDVSTVASSHPETPVHSSGGSAPNNQSSLAPSLVNVGALKRKSVQLMPSTSVHLRKSTPTNNDAKRARIGVNSVQSLVGVEPPSKAFSGGFHLGSAQINTTKGTSLVPNMGEITRLNIGTVGAHILSLKQLPKPSNLCEYMPPGFKQSKKLEFISAQYEVATTSDHIKGIDDDVLVQIQGALKKAHYDTLMHTVRPGNAAMQLPFQLRINAQNLVSSAEQTSYVGRDSTNMQNLFPIRLVKPPVCTYARASDKSYNNFIDFTMSLPVFHNFKPTVDDAINADLQDVPFSYVPRETCTGRTPTNDNLITIMSVGTYTTSGPVVAILQKLFGDDLFEQRSRKYLNDRNRVLSLYPQYCKTPGTIVGQLMRFGKALMISDKSVASVQDPMWIRPKFDIKCAFDPCQATVDDVRLAYVSLSNVRTNYGASTGFVNNNQRRDLLTNVADALYFRSWMMYRMAIDKRLGEDPNYHLTAKQLAFYNMARYAEMKPKDEVVERAILFNKSRTIFNLNAFTQIPIIYGLSVGELFEGRAMQNFDEPCLLGIDAQLFLMRFISTMRQVIKDCSSKGIKLENLPAMVRGILKCSHDYEWYSYSDNLYCFDFKHFTMYSFDGEKMESSFKGADLLDLMVDLFSLTPRPYQFRTTESALHYFASTDKYTEFEGIKYRKYVCNCLAPDKGFEPVHSNPALLEACEIVNFTEAIIRQMYYGTEFYLEVDDSNDLVYYVEKDPVVVVRGLSGKVPEEEVAPWLKSYINAMVDQVDNAITALGAENFHSTFLPSGARYTSIANTYKTLGTVLYLREHDISPEDFLVKYTPTSWVCKLESKTDLRDPLFVGTKYATVEHIPDYTVYRTDWLGFDILTLDDHMFVHLRQTALLTNPFYHTYKTKSHDAQARSNEVAMYVSAMLNGAIYFPTLLGSMLFRLTQLVEDTPLSVALVKDVMGVLGAINVDLSFLKNMDRVWEHIFILSYNRSAIEQDPEYGKKFAEVGVLINDCLGHTTVLTKVRQISTLQSMLNKKLREPINKLIKDQPNLPPQAIFYSLFKHYLDTKNVIDGENVPLGIFVSAVLLLLMEKFTTDYGSLVNDIIDQVSTEMPTMAEPVTAALVSALPNVDARESDQEAD